MAEEATQVTPNAELLEWPKKDKRRFLHAVYRVGDLDRTIKLVKFGFFTFLFGFLYGFGNWVVFVLAYLCERHVLLLKSFVFSWFWKLSFFFIIYLCGSYVILL